MKAILIGIAAAVVAAIIMFTVHAAMQPGWHTPALNPHHVYPTPYPTQHLGWQ